MSKKLLILFFIIFISLIFGLNFILNYNTKLFEKISKSIVLDSSYNYIAHGGGEINNLIYTNSKEAVLKSIENNFKLIELDLHISMDGDIFAFHDFKRLNDACSLNYKIERNFDTKSIMKCKKRYYANLTLLRDSDINDIFLSNDDLILVTDKIRDFSILKQKFLFRDRIIVEVFNMKDYLISKINGIKNPMYYFKGSKRDKIFIKIFKPQFISLHIDDVLKHKKYIRKIFSKKETLIYAYTSNDKVLNNILINNLIHGVYTDFNW